MTTRLCCFNCALTLSNSKMHRTLKNSLLISYLRNSKFIESVLFVIVYTSNCILSVRTNILFVCFQTSTSVVIKHYKSLAFVLEHKKALGCVLEHL
jgi:hypothetical protein